MALSPKRRELRSDARHRLYKIVMHSTARAGPSRPPVGDPGRRGSGAGCRRSTRKEQHLIRRPVWFQTPSVQIIGTNSQPLMPTYRSYLRPTSPPQAPGRRFFAKHEPRQPRTTARPSALRGFPRGAPRNATKPGFPTTSGEEVRNTAFRGRPVPAATSRSPRCRRPRAHERQGDLKSRVRIRRRLRS
jgi:hypothetical protein